MSTTTKAKELEVGKEYFLLDIHNPELVKGIYKGPMKDRTNNPKIICEFKISKSRYPNKYVYLYDDEQTLLDNNPLGIKILRNENKFYEYEEGHKILTNVGSDVAWRLYETEEAAIRDLKICVEVYKDDLEIEVQALLKTIEENNKIIQDQSIDQYIKYAR